MPLKNGKTTASLQTILIGSITPVGTVAPFAGNTAPDGWLLCDGSAISRTIYSALFAAIGTTYGVGDNSTTFNLPNTQGVFLRGAGSQTISGTSYSATRGASERDALQNITGTLPGGGIYQGNPSSGAFTAVESRSVTLPGSGRAFLESTVTFNPSAVARTSTETRPANIGVNYIIKL